VITLSQDNTIHDALLLMQKKEIKRIVIIKEDLPVGIVTERDLGRFLGSDKTSRKLSEIHLSEVMSRNLVTVSEDQLDISTQCAIRMDTFRISSVLIVNQNGKLVGITTKSDLVRNFLNLYPGIYKVKDYMSKTVVTCRKADSLYFALGMLNKNKISRLVVTDNEGNPLGIISYDSVFKIGLYGKNQTESTAYPFSKNSEKMLVGDIIGPDLIVVNPNDDLVKASKLMIEYKINGIPVVDVNGNLEGVIASTDIARAYAEVETRLRLIKRDPHFA